MFERHRRFQLFALLVVMSLLITACFRDTSEVIEQQPVARQLSSPTPVEEAEPTALPPTATDEPAPTEAAADKFALTATALIALQTQQAAGGQPTTGDQGVSAPALQPTAIPLPRSTIPPGADCVHEIRAGDTLFQLSLAYGVTVDAIADASGIDNPDRIAAGQHVTIPKCGTTGFIPPPTSVPPPTIDPALIPTAIETAELEIASAEDTRDTLVEQAQAALLDNAQAGAGDAFSIQSAAPSTTGQTYTVQQNDTLFEIATRFGTTVDALAALNNIEDVDSVDAGQVLDLP